MVFEGGGGDGRAGVTDGGWCVRTFAERGRRGGGGSGGRGRV